MSEVESSEVGRPATFDVNGGPDFQSRGPIFEGTEFVMTRQDLVNYHVQTLSSSMASEDSNDESVCTASLNGGFYDECVYSFTQHCKK